MASFWGKDTADRFTGTSDADSIYGGGGNDSLAGGLGNDLLDGGAGNDWLGDPYTGDPGNDRMYGRAGNDQIFGGEGNDYVDGGADADTVKGGRGDDTLVGGSGDDWLVDTLRDGGTDLFLPGTGNDHMVSYFDGLADVFRMQAAPGGFGHDSIQYFERGIDRIQFQGYTAGGMTVSSSQTGTTFSFQDGSSLTVDSTGLQAGRDYVFV
ncbi:calcium-binding protein [Azospirillum sp. sgz302134]